jgi:hypothetical protein
MGIIEAIGMPAGIIDGIVMEGMDIGICAAGFMVTSWLDNEPYGQYNRPVGRGVSVLEFAGGAGAVNWHERDPHRIRATPTILRPSPDTAERAR